MAVAAFLGLVVWTVWQGRRVAWVSAGRFAVLLAVAYLGIGGSFEDARVLWVAMGLLAGAGARRVASRASYSSRV